MDQVLFGALSLLVFCVAALAVEWWLLGSARRKGSLAEIVDA